MSDNTSFPKTRAAQHNRNADQPDSDPGSADERHRVSEIFIESLYESVRGVLRPVQNIRNVANAFLQAFNRQGFLKFGKITYAVPYTNWYHVQLMDQGGDVRCCAGAETAPQPFSVRSIALLPPNTPVLVWKEDWANWGVILCALPSIVVDAGKVHPDWISQGSHGGFKHEGYYHDLVSMAKGNAGLLDFSVNQPIDGSATGEWGKLNELGAGFFMDNIMQFMRLDESCGIWLWYYDRLLRLVCNNHDFRSAISERILRSDNGEGCDVSSFTPYPWEALGAFEFGTEIVREIEDEDVHFNKPYGKCEPKHDDQQAFYRWEEFRDYLGQGFMRHMMLPPESGQVNRYPDRTVFKGVFREHVSLDGAWNVETAHSYALVKRVIIPIPKRLLLPEDPTGDDLKKDSGYKFAGKHGNGKPHKIKDGPQPNDEEPHVLSATAMNEWLAYAFNWKTLHAFHYHKKDFYLPEETELSPLTSLQYRPDFSALSSSQFVPAPTAKPIKVDHRYPNAKYYETTAGLFVTPMGSVVLRSACGCELKMAGGVATLSGPADTMLQSGRHVVLMAGDDLVLKAHNSIDIMAANKDVRIKAERNGEFLAGNSQIGRLLLECRSAGIDHTVEGVEGEDLQDYGLIFKSKGEILQWARDIYIRTGGGELAKGQIVLDAAQGKQDVQIIAADMVGHFSSSVRLSFGVKEKEVCYSFGQYAALFPVPVMLGGGLIVAQNGILCNGNIIGINCTVASDSGQWFVANIPPGSKYWQDDADIIAEVQTDFESERKVVQTIYDNQVDQRWYAENRGGYDDVVDLSQFAPRNPEQMRTSGWKLAEVYYQQLIRAGGGGGTWHEPVITYQGEPMMPYPGKKAWSESSAFLQAKDKLYDTPKGLDKSRDSGLYEDDPDLLPWDRQIADGTYPVTV